MPHWWSNLWSSLICLPKVKVKVKQKVKQKVKVKLYVCSYVNIKGSLIVSPARTDTSGGYMDIHLKAPLMPLKAPLTSLNALPMSLNVHLALPYEHNHQ